LKTIEAVLRQQKVAIENLYPYQDAAKIQMIRRFGELQEEEYREDGIFVRAYVPVEIYDKVKVSRGDSPKSPL
ncbi:MAG: GTPase HflX, partial [[Clostridium] scindens]